MNHRSWVRLLLATFSIVAVSSPAAAQPEEGTVDRLAAALDFVTPAARNVAFTDWATMKAAHGLEALTSSIPDDLRIDTMIELTRTEAPFARFGLDRFIGHAEAWSWDSTDLEWEAEFFGDGGGVNVLRFRDGFDLAPFVTLLDERDFDARAVGDATVWSHPMEFGNDWINTTGLAILNTAVLADGRTIVLANSPDSLDAALAAGADDASDADIVSSLDDIGPIHSAFIEFGPETCANYDPRSSPDPEAATVELIDAVGPLAAWDVLVMTTGRDAAGEPIGHLRLSFPTASPAQLEAEAKARSRLAREGISRRSGAPYPETAFVTRGAGVAEDLVSIEMAPLDGRHATFAAAVFGRDLLPAMCG